MESETEPTDEQLDQLLRDVAIPQNLKSRLSQISIQHERENSAVGSWYTTPEPKEKPMTSWMALALAASLIGVGLFVAFQFWPESGNGGPEVVKIADEGQPQVDSDVPSAETDQHKIRLAEFLKGQEQLDAALHAMEVAQMESQLANLEQSAPADLEQHEVESMIAAMSEEYSIPLGMPEGQVELRMAQVIERYPGTRGAQIAHEFLNQDIQ